MDLCLSLPELINRSKACSMAEIVREVSSESSASSTVV